MHKKIYGKTSYTDTKVKMKGRFYMALSKENSCAFYASDYHLEMIMLPYINENFKNNKKVYVFTQNNMEVTVNHLVENVILDENKKKKILNINWKNEDENKYNSLINEDRNTVIFVKGDQEYINKVNKNLNQIKNYKDIEIIDCYSIEEVDSNANKIREKYNNVLLTNGKI